MGEGEVERYHVERLLCSVEEGAVHFALLAGNHSILELKGQEGPSGTWNPASHPVFQKQLSSSGAGKMHHSELGHLP